MMWVLGFLIIFVVAGLAGVQLAVRPANDMLVDKQFGFVSAGGELERIACLRARDDFGEIVGRGNVDGGCKGRLNHAAEHKCQDSASPCFELGCVHGVPLIRAVCVGTVMPACEGRVFVL